MKTEDLIGPIGALFMLQAGTCLYIAAISDRTKSHNNYNEEKIKLLKDSYYELQEELTECRIETAKTDSKLNWESVSLQNQINTLNARMEIINK